MERLKRNAIRCRHCGEVIESINRHDFRTVSYTHLTLPTILRV